MKSPLLILSAIAMTLSFAAVVAKEDREDLQLFAVEITVGPNWDNSLAPAEQAFFSEHSANLKHLREAGHIIMGARYSDKGLVVFSASSAAAVSALMNQDPAMEAGTFVYEVHVFSVFYPGNIKA